MSDTNPNWAQGRIALVTGATSGFGQAMARRILKAGGRVIATGRRVERLEELKREGGEMLLAVPLDLREADAGHKLIADLPEAFRAIDIAFNNAGLALGLEPAQKADLAEWEQMIETNVTGLVRIAHAILPGMVERRRGHIINMSSVAGTYPYPGGNVYGATKAFVRQFSLNLRADLLGTPVKVTSVEPGACETEFSQVRFRGDDAAAANVYKGMKPLTAEDVVDTVEAVLRLPEHLNVNSIEIMPVQQAFAPFAISREEA